MEYDADEEIEKHRKQVQNTGTICLRGMLILFVELRVLKSHEQGRHRRGQLQREKSNTSRSNV